MTATDDSGADDIARDQARTILERWTPFARMSRRLLTDLLERSEVVELTDDWKAETDIGPDAKHKDNWTVAFVVVDDEIEVGTADGKQESVGVGARHRSQIAGADKASLRFRRRPPTRETGDLGHVRHVNPRIAVLKASTLNPEVAWSLESRKLPSRQTRWSLNHLCRPELIWCDTDLGSRTHLAPLVHLLAATLAKDLREATVVVTLRSARQIRADLFLSDDGEKLNWHRFGVPGQKPDRFGVIKKLTEGKLKEVVRKWDHGRRRRSHVFVVDPHYSGQWPDALDKHVRFDRIVHLTDHIPQTVPDHLRDLLDHRVFLPHDAAPYYSSFISSVLVAKDVRRRARQRGVFRSRRVRFARRTQKREPYQYLSRLERDACVVPVDLPTLENAWQQWSKAEKSGVFLASSLDKGISTDSLSRWGRAITNRRVGIALSGGGACAYRVGPLLAQLERAKVPVDVFAGLSGGALVGAFFCHSGLTGFSRVVTMGPFIQLTAPLAMVTTWPLEAIVDQELGGVRVEDLEVRFAAVAVALPPDDQPMTEVVVSGTLGEAVRVSGTLPPTFAHTVKGGMRYTDGGAGTIVPAQVARDFGADIVLACNAVPGPARSNPVPHWLRWPLAICAPWMQRQIDFFAWHSYFWRQASQRFLREADVALEFPPETISMLEAGQWMMSREIVNRAKRWDAEIGEVVNDLKGKLKRIGDRWTLL